MALLSLLALSSICAAAPPADPLHLPLTPGVVALLAPRAGEPEVSARLMEALSDPQSPTRAAAARAVHVTRLASLVPRVREILRHEADPAVAREQCQVLAALGQASDLAEVYAAAERLPDLVSPLSGILAREKGPAALDLLADAAFRNLPLTSADRARFIQLATREDPQQLSRAFNAALKTRDVAFWSAALSLALSRSLTVDPQILADALDVSDPTMQADTAWFLAGYLSHNMPVRAAELLAALEANHKLDPPDGIDADAAMGFEFLARLLGRTSREHPEWIVNLGRSFESEFRELRKAGIDLQTLLTPSEAEAIAGQDRRCNTRLHPVGKAAPIARTQVLMRTVSDLPPGLLQDTLRLTGCKLGKKDTSGVASVRYDTSGRPTVERWFERPKGPACERAAELVLALALAPLDEVPRSEPPHTVALLLDQEGACAASPAGTAAFPQPTNECRDSADAPEAPKPMKQVQPRYTDAAREKGIEGLVHAEAVISQDGCPEDIRIWQAPAYELALPTLEALSRWRFQPARIGGKAVPVYFSLTVNYTLRR